MNLRQLEAFRATMVAGTVTGAAARLRISQPAVSRLISQLERTTKLVLFIRSKQRVYPTCIRRRAGGRAVRSGRSSGLLLGSDHYRPNGGHQFCRLFVRRYETAEALGDDRACGVARHSRRFELAMAVEPEARPR